MQELAGKAAFVTGAANGIGRGIALSLAKAGVDVALGDIEPETLERVREQVSALGVRALAIPLDVSDAAAVEAAAERVAAEFGRVHICVNNAGVSLGRVPAYQLAPEQWGWLFGVNVFGVVNGVRAFLPLIRQHGEEGHIVNTASIAGLQVNPLLRNGSYAMSKFAVVAFSEALDLELADTPVGVSVLCPALVTTTLAASSTRRPARFGGPYDEPGRAAAAALLGGDSALPPEAVGERVVHAIHHREFFIFTHAEPRQWLERRHRRIMAGFDDLERYQAQRAGGRQPS